MKKTLVFSLLLLAVVAITTGCGASSEWTPPGGTQLPVKLLVPAGTETEYELLTGEAQTVGLDCANSAIDVTVAPATGIRLERVGSCGFTFTASVPGEGFGASPVAAAPGIYKVTATAIRDRSKKVTVEFTVKPDFQISGPKKILLETEGVFTTTGAGTAASLAAAGSTLAWSFDDEGAGIGDIDEDGLFTATDTLGAGTVTAELYDALTNETYTATFDIKVVKSLGVTVPDELASHPPVGSAKGLWGDRAPDTYDPNLDGKGIPENAHVYGTFDWGTFTPYPAPDSIDGYNKVEISDEDFSVLKPGEWAVYSYSGGFGPTSYVIIVPDYEAPDELAEHPPVGSANGRWGDKVSDTYDPNLDGKGITSNAYVYATFDWSTFTPYPAPDSIEGYDKVEISDEDYSVLKPGEWAVYSYSGGFGPTSYVIIFPGGFED
ncbi:MAG: hypothetical protein FWF13_02970 [Acidobacteria bacterium]|nr:hypothetical protein [Acidobacteriota bacterium]